MKKINQMEFLEMKNTRDRINSRFFTTEEKIGEFADMETIQNEDQRTSNFYLGYKELQRISFLLLTRINYKILFWVSQRAEITRQ